MEEEQQIANLYEHQAQEYLVQSWQCLVEAMNCSSLHDIDGGRRRDTDLYLLLSLLSTNQK
jgi:hypothetical protein